MQIAKNKIKKRDRCRDRPKKYKCKKCSKNYQSEGALKDHMRKNHNNEIKNTNRDKNLPGRPKGKNQGSKEEKILMEEEIYQKSLEMLLDLQANFQKQKKTIFLTEQDDFFDLEGELDIAEKDFQIKCNEYDKYSINNQLKCFQLFLHGCVEFVENPKSCILELDPKETIFDIKLKKLAFVVLKFGHFLEKNFYEYFVALNLEILKKILSQSIKNLDRFVYEIYEKNERCISKISEEILNCIRSFEKEYFEHIKKFIQEDQQNKGKN